MRHNLIGTVVTWMLIAAVGLVFWILVIAAVVHVFGCSMSLEVESEMHHHEGENIPLLEPTPTPAARIN